MVKYAGNGRLDRRLLNRCFGQKNARPDAECWDLEAFVVNTMSGCGWDCRSGYDLLMFCKEFDITLYARPNIWFRWFAGSAPKEDKWAVVEKRDGVPMWCWFQKSMMLGEWVTLDQDCVVTKKIVPFKNGFFKTVPL